MNLLNKGQRAPKPPAESRAIATLLSPRANLICTEALLIMFRSPLLLPTNAIFYQIINSHLLYRPDALIWLCNLSTLLQKQTQQWHRFHPSLSSWLLFAISPLPTSPPNSRCYYKWQVFTHVGPPDSKETTLIKEDFVATKAISILSENENNRAHPCWKSHPTRLCSVSFNNVICSTQGSDGNKAGGLFSAPIPFLEGRRGEFYVPFVCQKFFM